MRKQAQHRLPTAPSCPPTIGSKLEGRYQLTRLLASGSHGHVYEGVDMHTGLEAAVKLFPSSVLPGDEARKRFLENMGRVAAVQHANLVRTLGFGLIGERRPFVAMERLRGVTLRARLRQVGLLPVRHCLRVLYDVLRGLTAAHAANATHGDLHPGHVFLDPRGAVLFGLGLETSESRQELPAAVRTQSQRPDAKVRDDLYGVSAMAYEMLTGRLPLDSVETQSRGPCVLPSDHPLQPPSALQPPIAPDIDDWVMRGLSEDPGLRFVSAEEMGADCEQLLGRLGD